MGEYAELYDFDYGTYSKEDWEASVRVQASYEIAIKRFFDERGYNAFTRTSKTCMA